MLALTVFIMFRFPKYTVYNSRYLIIHFENVSSIRRGKLERQSRFFGVYLTQITSDINSLINTIANNDKCQRICSI